GSTPASSTRSPTLDLSLAPDAESRPRTSLEPLLRDLAPATRAGAEGAAVDSLERLLDPREHLFRMPLEGVVDLAVACARGGVAEVVVGVAEHLLGLVFEGARCLAMEVLDRAFDSSPLVEQGCAEALGVHGPPFPSAAASNRSTRRGSSPSSNTTFSRDACPDTSASRPRGTSSVSASSRSTASFARPFSGGSATRTFHASPCRPALPGF